MAFSVYACVCVSVLEQRKFLTIINYNNFCVFLFITILLLFLVMFFNISFVLLFDYNYIDNCGVCLRGCHSIY